MPDPIVVEPPPPVVPPVAPVNGDNHSDDIDPRVPSLMKRLFDTVEDEPKKPDAPKDDRPKTEPKKDDKPPVVDPKATTAPKAGEPAEQPIRLRKAKLVRPDLPIEAPKPIIEQPAPVTDKPDPQWESGLDETQREMLADARDAEKRFPDRHKGLAARTAKFLKDDATQRAGAEFDDQSQEYRAWLEKNQPKMSRQDVRELEETRVADRVQKEWRGKYDDLQHKMFVQNTEPKIEQEARQIFNQLSQTSLPDEIAEAIRKDGYDKASETYKLELETAQEVLTTIADDLKEFKKLSTKDPETGRALASETTDPRDPRFPIHQRLGVMVTNVCENFKNQAPADQQLRNGKWFVTRDEWMSIRPDQRHRYWTFNNAELANVAQGVVKQVVAAKIQEKRASFSRFGWQPPVTKAAPAPQPKYTPPVPTNTPRTPGPSAVPGTTDPMPDIDARALRLAAQLNRSE